MELSLSERIARELAEHFNGDEGNEAHLYAYLNDPSEENRKLLSTWLAAIIDRHLQSQWQPIEIEPTEQFLLLSGVNSDGKRWRDVGVYQGSDEAGRHFVDKYGAGSQPTHWMPLPSVPDAAPVAERQIECPACEWKTSTTLFREARADEYCPECGKVKLSQFRDAATSAPSPQTITVDYETWLAACGVAQHNVELAACLTRILRDLPTHRDWLDPEVEQWARRLTTAAPSPVGEGEQMKSAMLARLWAIQSERIADEAPEETMKIDALLSNIAADLGNVQIRAATLPASDEPLDAMVRRYIPSGTDEHNMGRPLEECLRVFRDNFDARGKREREYLDRAHKAEARVEELETPVTDEQLAEAQRLYEATSQGVWSWNINLKTKQVRLESDGARQIVMDFARWGSGGAKPRFNLNGIMEGAEMFAQVVEGREHHSSWYQTLRHPDTDWIAAAHNLWPKIVARVQAPKYRADFLFGRDEGSIEEAGYEFANGVTEDYVKQWWNILIERGAEVVWQEAIRIAKQPINTVGWGSASGGVAQQVIVKALESARSAVREREGVKNDG